MTNIVPLRNTGGFTRMDNQLMDGLMAIDLSAREMKIVLYVAKATLNFNEGAQRIPATAIAKATHIHPDTVSKAISSLLRRRVLFRDGGARGDIGLCDPKEWVFVEDPKQTKSSDSAQIVRIGSTAKQTKTDDSLLYSKNKTPYVNLPSEDITCPPKAEIDPVEMFSRFWKLYPRKVGKEKALKAWGKLKLTAALYDLITAALAKHVQQKSWTRDGGQFIPHAATWLNGKRWEDEINLEAESCASPAQSRHHGFQDIDYTQGMTARGDGSYDF